MNTEPPEGDDLQRMLVSMKRNVLDRAAPRPERRRGRSGLVIGVVALLAVGTATGAVALTLSQQDEPVASPVQTQEPEPAPSATTPTSAPITASPTPRPTPALDTTATLPTTCRGTVPASDYDRFFGTTPLTESTEAKDGPLHTDAADISWAGNPATMICEWSDPRADVSGLTMSIGTLAPEAVGALDRSPLRCEDRDGGRMCQSSERAEPYPVDQTTTWFTRGDTFIVIRQANFPTDGLLDAVIGEIWGD